MKIGDLVTLSNYGANRQFNRNIDPYHVGLVVAISMPYSSYPYRVMWSKVHTHRGYGNFETHSRRELKYAKKTS